MNPQSLAGALGTGLAEATIWFPITYFAMRKQFRLRTELGNAWRPYMSCVVLLAAFELLGFRAEFDSGSGFLVSMVLPITICAAALYINDRRTP